MNILNIHERRLEATCNQVGALIDTLASSHDRLWPKHLWPPMKFDRPLGVGADGGHGPIRYYVEEYTPGNSIKFRFTGPKGFDGYHRLDVLEGLGNTVVIRHTLEMKTHGLAIISWPLTFRHLHDALVEDAFTVAEQTLGLPLNVQPWSLWVKILRWFLTGGKAQPQRFS